MPSLRFDFEDAAGVPSSRTYRRPVAVWRADRLEEVLPVLAACDAALSKGLHVAGFVAYEAAPAFDDSLVTRAHGSDVPLAWFGAFPEPKPSAPLIEGAPASLEPILQDQSALSHARSVARIREHIAAGDAYQVNHTLRLHYRLRGTGPGLYSRLHARQPAQYAAHLRLGDLELLSCSPELFFRRSGNLLTARPMKGTAARGTGPGADAASVARLLASEKERAENIMITDLLRNDLGRLAIPGTVAVPGLLQVETHATFHALTSTVRAEVPGPTGLGEVFGALFPCGSVTGAPKGSAMEVIAAQELQPRGAYCGAIGFAAPGGEWVFSVAIRTLQLNTRTGTAVYGTGGGITWDSDARAEYAEAMLKARFLMDAGR